MEIQARGYRVTGTVTEVANLLAILAREDEAAREAAERPQHLADRAWLDGECHAFMMQGEWIQAIKRLRTMTGSGLREAKEAVEKAMADHGLRKGLSGA